MAARNLSDPETCICPDDDDDLIELCNMDQAAVVVFTNGELLDPKCPVHGAVALAVVQRMFESVH